MSSSDVRCFCGAPEMSDKERAARAQRGGGVCSVRADGQAADGLGGKPGTGLPFLDGSTSDAQW